MDLQVDVFMKLPVKDPYHFRIYLEFHFEGTQQSAYLNQDHDQNSAS